MSETEGAAERVSACLPCVRPWRRVIAPEKRRSPNHEFHEQELCAQVKISIFFLLLLLFKFKLHETKLVALGMEGLFLAPRSIIFDIAHKE